MAAAAAAAGLHGAAGSVDGTLAMTRRRSAHIDRLVDMIPARFYLNGDHQQILQNQQKCLDPALIKTTSQLVAEAAKLLGSEKAAASSSGAGTTRNNSGKKRKLGGAGNSGAVPASRTANSKEDLRRKLEERISELRDERKRKESEAKAKAAAKRAEKEKEGTARGWRIEANGKEHAAPLTLPEEDIELGRLNHAPRTAELPFQADVNRKGNKVRRRQEALRQEEANQRRLQQAESRGEDAQELRRDILMKKALKRAGGEKVHDDVSKLRKAQKMHEVRKAKSQEKWKQRKEDLKTQQDDRQAQRKENLKKKAMNKKKNKGKRSGFEGKRSGYMNAE